jgi:nitronate monooxygenase
MWPRIDFLELERLDLVLKFRPRVVCFHFGLPEASAVRQIKEAGCLTRSPY